MTPGARVKLRNPAKTALTIGERHGTVEELEGDRARVRWDGYSDSLRFWHKLADLEEVEEDEG